MFKNYSLMMIRILSKNKLFSLINIMGLAMGLAAAIIITLFVRQEIGYDTFWKNGDNLYRLNTHYTFPNREPTDFAASAGPSKHALKQYFSDEILETVRIHRFFPTITKDGETFSQRMMFVDPGFVDLFNLDVLAGDLALTLNDNASIALSETEAIKYFGGDTPFPDMLGQTLHISTFDIDRDFKVGAIYKDLPDNTIMDLPALVKINESEFENHTWVFQNWFSNNAQVYFRIKNGTNIDHIKERLQSFVDDTVILPENLRDAGVTVTSEVLRYSVQNIGNIYLNSPGRGEYRQTGNLQTVSILSLIATFILLIACVNFVNLSTAKATARAREVALRKILGAKRKQLIAQFMGETLFLVFVAMVLALVIIEISLPVLTEAGVLALTISYSDTGLLGLLALLAVLTSVLGGLYPALILSSYRPGKIIQSNKSSSTKGSRQFRSALVIMQFAISVAMIVATSTVYSQFDFLSRFDRGFNSDNLLYVHGIARTEVRDRKDALQQSLLQLPSVTHASYSFTIPTLGPNNNISLNLPDKPEAGSVLIGQQIVDYDYFKTLEIPFLAGRSFDRARSTDQLPPEDTEASKNIAAAVISLSSVGKLGFKAPEDAIGKKIIYPRDIPTQLEIIGVVPDLQYQSLKKVSRPEIYMLDPDRYLTIAIRYKGSEKDIIKDLESVWENAIGNVPLNHIFMSELIERELAEENEQTTLFAGFSVLAILIACLGLFGLASFNAESRTKEIGVRKVMGAAVHQIVQLLIWQFSKPVILANIIAWPVVTYLMLGWLENYPYRIDEWMMAPICLGVGVFVMLVSWATVGYNAARVARTNPIKALRYE